MFVYIIMKCGVLYFFIILFDVSLVNAQNAVDDNGCQINRVWNPSASECKYCADGKYPLAVYQGQVLGRRLMDSASFEAFTNECFACPEGTYYKLDEANLPQSAYECNSCPDNKWTSTIAVSDLNDCDICRAGYWGDPANGEICRLNV